MQEKYYKYAHLLLERGLYIKKEEPLVVSAPIEAIDFIRVLTDVACGLGVNDIYYDWYDSELEHTQLKYYDLKQFRVVDFGIRKYMMNMQNEEVLSYSYWQLIQIL